VVHDEVKRGINSDTVNVPVLFLTVDHGMQNDFPNLCVYMINSVVL
jgi:hypothetical protein